MASGADVDDESKGCIAVQAEHSLAKTELAVAQSPVFTPEHDGHRLALEALLSSAGMSLAEARAETDVPPPVGGV